MYQYEYETLDRELQNEFETASNELNNEYEYEYESEQFLPFLLPILKAAAPAAIKGIGSLFSRRRRRTGQREFEMEFETTQNEYEGEYEGDAFIGNLLQGLSGLLGESEYEQTSEALPEYESTPSMNEYEVMAEHLAHMAANSQSEAEAEAFLGAMIPMIARGVSAATPALTRIAPRLIRPMAQAGRALFRNQRTRPLLRTMPQIARRTISTLSRNMGSNGQVPTEQTAARALASNVAQVLGSPQKTAQIMRRSRVIHNRTCAQCKSGKRLSCSVGL